ncbi:MAG: hypothetical protein JWR27_237 [Aeromicrobium sp.]|nr:hypothetical protein [Aeromicrobium sp.]
MRSFRSTLRSGLRSATRRAGDGGREGDVDVHGLICTFSSVEILGRLGADPRSDAVTASLVPGSGRTIGDIRVDVTGLDYRLQLPVRELAGLPEGATYTLWLHSGRGRRRLARRPSPARGPVTLPHTVLRLDEDAVGLRITSKADGTLVLHARPMAGDR